VDPVLREGLIFNGNVLVEVAQGNLSKERPLL
jgi:hypothetical protein